MNMLVPNFSSKKKQKKILSIIRFFVTFTTEIINFNNKMTLETLYEANKIAKEIDRWKDITTRLACGHNFFQINFKAHKNKTMFTEFEYIIIDENTINTFREFAETQLREYHKQLEKL